MPQTVEIEGVGPVEFPDDATDSDILEAASHLAPATPPPPPVTPAPKPGWMDRFHRAAAEANPEMPFIEGLSEIPEAHMGVPLPRVGFTPQVGDQEQAGGIFGIPGPITQSLTRGQTRKLGAVGINALASGAEGLLSPETPLILAGAAAAPEVVLPLMTASMAKSGSTLLAEAQEDFRQGRESEGVRKMGEATTALGFAAAPALHPSAMAPKPPTPLILPRSLAAAREAGVEVPETVAPSASPVRTIGEAPPIPERLPRGQQVLAQEPLAGEFRVKEDSVRTEIEAAEAKATAEIAEAWKQMTEAEKDNARHGRGIPKRFGGRAPDIAETGTPPLPAAPAPTPTPPLPVVAPPMQLPTAHGAPPAEQKPPEPIGGPDALQVSSPEAQVRGMPSQPGVDEGAMPTQEGTSGVPRSVEAEEAAGGTKIPLAEAPKAEPAAPEPAPVQPVEAKPAELPESAGKTGPSVQTGPEPQTITVPDEGKASAMTAEGGVVEKPSPPAARRQVERPPDIIDEIQARIGKVSLTASRKIRELLKPTGAARKLFTRRGGNAPDAVLDALHREGLFRNITTEDELLQAIEDAAESRKGNRGAKSAEQREIVRQEAQRIDFERAVAGKRTSGEPKKTQAIDVGELLEGDEFKLAGVKVKVKELVVDHETGEVSHVVLEDGRRFEEQTLARDATIQVDSGTFISPEEPPSLAKREELFGETPFNLAGEKLRQGEAPKAPETRTGQTELFELQKATETADPVKSANAAEALYGGAKNAIETLERQLRVIDSDPYLKGKQFDPEQRARLKQVLALLRERADIGEGPGAKTAGAPRYPAIQQLTDQLEATPKLGKNKRGYLEAIADTWARRGDITTKAIARTRVATVNALRSLEGIRKATDIDRELGEYDYAIQYSSSASKRAGEAMKRQMRDVTDREAAAILIDSARIATDPRNPAEVRQVIKDGLDVLPADTPKSVRAAMERALDPSLELRQFSESLKQYFGIREQDAVDADLFSQGLEDYYTHVWEKESNMPNSLRDAIATGRVNTYFQFARQRKIPTLIEGILEGKKPILDPAKVIPFYNFAMDRAIASRTFIKSLSDVMASDHTPGNPRPAVDVRGGATVVDPLDAKSDPAVLITPKTQAQNIRDYKVVNHPALQKWKWLTTTPEGRQVLMRGDLVVHPEFYTQLKRFMDRDVTTASKFTRRAMAISGTAKGLKLGLIPTTFHIAHVGAHAAFHWTNPFRWAPIDFEAPATRFAIEKGHLKLAPSPSELTLMAEGLGSSGLIRKIPYFGEWSGAFSDWMFHQYIPRLKLNTFENAMNRPVFGARSKFTSTGRALKAGRLTENDVAARAGDAVNNAFGELNHLFLGKVGRDPRFQRFLQLAFLAPDFGEARARFALKSFSRYGSEERLALATMGAALYFGARLGNYLSHGNMESDDWRHAFEVKVKDEKGKWHWLGARSVVGDILHAIDRPGQFIYTRLNPITSRPTTDLLYGREERTGRKLSFQERIERVAGAFVPIGLGGLTEPDRTALESLGQSMGLANRRDMAVNDIARKAHDWLDSIGRRPMSEIIPTDEPSYLKLRTAINIGKMGDAKKLLEGLLKTRSHKEIEKAMVNYLEHPYTGSKELEKQWATTFTKKDAQQYLDAQKEKMDTLMDFYKLLGATLNNP